MYCTELFIKKVLKSCHITQDGRMYQQRMNWTACEQVNKFDLTCQRLD